MMNTEGINGVLEDTRSWCSFLQKYLVQCVYGVMGLSFFRLFFTFLVSIYSVDPFKSFSHVPSC